MKKAVIVCACALSFAALGQDSINAKNPVPLKRNEIGLNVLPPILLLAGVNSAQTKYFNATYKRFLSERNALRVTAGVNVFNTPTNPNIIKSTFVGGGLTLNKVTTTSTPINVQGSLGYERVMGKRRLKHVIGADLTYNYVNERVLSEYYGTKDTTINNIQMSDYIRIDTGRTVKNNYVHKFGITPFYSIRYPITKRWLLTTSVRANFQMYKRKVDGYPDMTISDFNLNGLLSEVSLFYRF